LLVSGTRLGRVQISVNGRLRRDIRPAILQKRVIPRVRLAPGRDRIRVRVTFQLGSGKPPLTLSRIVRVCRALALRKPNFTG
jgi:hypothetical protein